MIRLLHPEKARLARHYLLLLVVVGGVAGFLDYANGYRAAAAVELFSAAAALPVLWVSGRPEYAGWAGGYGVLATFAILLVASATELDRAENLVWLPVFPLVFFFLTSARTGLALSLASMAAIMASYLGYFLLPLGPHVPLDTTAELLGAYVFSTAIAYYYENARFSQHAELRRLADQDQLTGVLNRRGFYEVAPRAGDPLGRRETGYAIVLLDIDNFKIINDEYGHPAGDEVLRGLARQLQRQVRVTDVVARWGGEEFILYLPNTGLSGARELAEKIRTSLREVWVPNGPVFTASFGVAARHQDEDLETVIGRADAALYAAKFNRKDRVEVDP